MRGKIDFWSKLTVCALGALVAGYFFIRYLLVLFLPFLIAWGLAFVVRAPALALAKKIHIPPRALRLIMVGALSFSVVFLFFFLMWKLILQGWRLLGVLGENREMLAVFERVMNPRGSLVRLLPSGIAEVLSEALSGALSSLSSAFASFAGHFVASVPRVFLFILVLLIASVYFALDLEKINSFVKSKLPQKTIRTLQRLKNGIFGVGIKYAKAYFVITLITLGIILSGLLLLGVEYALFISVIISLLDILPVIGIGTVLVPWGVFQIFFGSRALGIGLIILFLLAEFVRQLAEPKILGKHLGLHPIISLALLYGSYSIFGLVGILIIPIAVVTVNALLAKDDFSEIGKGSIDKSDGA